MQEVEVDGMTVSDKTPENIKYDLLTLVNTLMHSSYQFILLTSVSRKLKLKGFAWATRKKVKKYTDSVLMVLDWINENGGFLELADVAVPRFEPSKLTPLFVVTRWDEVEAWVKGNIESILDKVEKSYYLNKTELISMLNSILNQILSYS